MAKKNSNSKNLKINPVKIELPRTKINVETMKIKIPKEFERMIRKNRKLLIELSK